MTISAVEAGKLNQAGALNQQIQLGTELRALQLAVDDLDPIAGKVYHRFYYVDGNAGLDTNSGDSWDEAFLTLPVALAASHADIAADHHGWAGRNAILCKGDSFGTDDVPVNLVKFAQKTDVIGVGSCDHRPMARVIGNVVSDSTSYMGCRFINFCFKGPTIGGKIVRVLTQQSGIEFINCEFEADSGTLATHGVEMVASERFALRNCRFTGKFSTAAIAIGAGACNGLVIENNDIESGAIGILVDISMTCALRAAIARNNTFNVGTLCIDDNSDKLVIVGNKGRTAADGVTVGNVFDYNVKLASNNVISHDTGTTEYPERTTAAGKGITTLEAAIAVIDALLDVPTVDLATDATMNQVVGKKADTVAGTSLVALVKQAVALGTEVKKTTIADSATIPNNDQVAAGLLATATGGDVMIEDIIVQRGAVNAAGPTNYRFSTDNVNGLTGKATPVGSMILAKFNANKTSILSIDGVVKQLPFVLCAGKKLFIDGDDAPTTGAVVTDFFIKYKKVTTASTLV